jgi:hypothetical protein
MALNDVTINKGQGGLGRPLEGTDYVSGLLFYTGATLPSGFTSNDRIKIVYSVSDAESLGITNTHLGATASTATIQNTTKCAVADTINIVVATINGNVTITQDTSGAAGVYTFVTGDDTSKLTTVTAIAANINAGTLTHGFSALASGTDLCTITAPTSQGVFLNTGTPYTVTVTGTIANTTTQSVVSGVASDIDIIHYHISEFFRLQPKGKLYVSLQATADVGTFSKITDTQNFAEGEIKQLAIYQKGSVFATSQCNAIQSVCTTLEGLHKPVQVILAAEISGTAAISGLTSNLHALSDPNVSVTIGQDGAATGYTLFKATGKSITNVGEMLGAVALSKVSESIAWLGKFQVATTELDTVAFANGQNFKDISDNQVTALDTLGYCFLRKVTDLTGTYHNRPYTCVALTSDYCFIHPNRTIYKAVKNLRATILPAVGSPIKVNADGTLSIDVINYFKSLGEQALDTLLRNAELSNYAVIIDSSQDVLSTGILEITAELQPIGTADFISVNVGFVLSITN